MVSLSGLHSLIIFMELQKKIVKEKIEEGTNVLLEIELEGARQIRKSFPEAFQIFLAPPNLYELEKRIRGRGTETEESIRDRLSIAEKELIAQKEFDAVVINEDIEKAFKEIEGFMGLKL
jgi:guanylate kinase